MFRSGDKSFTRKFSRPEQSKIDDELLETLLEQSKELGPDVLKDSKYDTLLRPFELEWTFGFDISVPIINLTNKERREIFYSATNTGIIYDYCKKTMRLLRGHQQRIVSASSDKTGKWLATADNGKDNVIMVWNTNTCDIVWTIFDHPQSGNLLLLALSPNAKLLITISDENENTIDFWLWTYGEDKPHDTYTDDRNLGAPHAIEFHPNKEDHIMVVYDKAVLFFVWDYENKKVSEPVSPKCTLGRGVGNYTDGTYVDFCHEAFVSTSKGNVLVFGNTIYARHYENEEGIDNNKMFVKSIRVSKGSVSCITSVDEIIVIGDSNGNIMFFDKRLTLLYWFAKRVTQQICTISFKLCPRKYKLDKSKPVVEVEDYYSVPDCQDRSQEYEILMAKNMPQDATLEKKLFIARDNFLSTADGAIYMVNFPLDKFISIFPTADSNVAAIDVHDEFPYIVIAYSKGRLIIYDYETHEEIIASMLPETDKESTVTAIKYSPQCLHLACGKSNGELWILQPATLSQVYVDPFKFSTKKVLKIVFSQNSLQMAYYDENMTIFGFYYDTETEDWVFKGKVRPHYKDICNILFLDEEPYGLYSMGRDRNLVKYTDLINEGEIDISVRDRIEQKDVPIYFIAYPKGKFSKSGYFLVADDKHKFKQVSIRTNMCTAVYLGPAYGCFENNPVRKMEFIPENSKKYLAFMTEKQIGIQLVPIDGNPYKYVGCLAHPEQLLDFQLSHDGRYIFTVGKNDRTVFKWRIKVESVDAMYQLGGVELQPFYCLLEGGRGGFLYQEMRDLFYYMQILQQGEKECAPRVVSNHINIGELPDLMRACGYYPSEYEIENLLTDIRYKEFDDKGILKDKVTFCEFVKLFINHKPAYGYSVETLEDCFEVVTSFTDEYGSTSMPTQDFIEAITTTGEQVSNEQIYRCLVTLMHAEEDSMSDQFGERDFSFMADDIDFDYLTEEILGIDMSTVERLREAGGSGGSYGGYGGYGYGDYY